MTTFLRESVPAYDARFSQTRLLFHGHRYLVQLVKENIANPRRANWSELVCHTIPENGLTPEPLSLLDKIQLMLAGGARVVKGQNCGLLYRNEDGWLKVINGASEVIPAEQAHLLVILGVKGDIPFSLLGVMPTPFETPNFDGRSIITEDSNRATGESTKIRLSMDYQSYLTLVYPAIARDKTIEIKDAKARTMSEVAERFFGDAGHVPANLAECEGIWKAYQAHGKSRYQLEQMMGPGRQFQYLPDDLKCLETIDAWLAYYNDPIEATRREAARTAARDRRTARQQQPVSQPQQPNIEILDSEEFP